MTNTKEDAVFGRILRALQAEVDREQPAGRWLQVTQERINAFADATGDYQWIHVDVPRARESPFGAAIAHGNLTLSLIAALCNPNDAIGRILDGRDEEAMTINYGFDRIRFPAPVRAGTRIRAARTLRRAEPAGEGIALTTEVVVNTEGETKPACIAESLTRLVFAKPRSNP